MKTSILRVIIVTVAILLVPLIAMQFSSEVKWQLADFIIAGLLLFGAGMAIEIAFKKLSRPLYKIAVVIGILAVLVLIWAELAVGVFGTPFAGS